MTRPVGRVALLGLLAGLVAVAIVATVLHDRAAAPDSLQRQAAERMASAFPVLVSALEARGHEIDARVDPNRTGLIGEEFTVLTTTVGALSAKRTSTNPAFASLIVGWLRDLDLQAGDAVLISLSGSFPALGIAAIVACETLGLEPIVLSSVGASMYGANRPDFTWLDIEAILRDAGVIAHTTARASLGGEGDIGLSYPDGGREAALAAIERSGVAALIEETAEAQWASKAAFADSVGSRALINVGGNQLAVGPDGHLLAPGLVTRTGVSAERFGLIGRFRERGLPVIHLLRIRDLAVEHGLPLDPIPLPSP